MSDEEEEIAKNDANDEDEKREIYLGFDFSTQQVRVANFGIKYKIKCINFDRSKLWRWIQN